MRYIANLEGTASYNIHLLEVQEWFNGIVSHPLFMFPYILNIIHSLLDTIEVSFLSIWPHLLGIFQSSDKHMGGMGSGMSGRSCITQPWPNRTSLRLIKYSLVLEGAGLGMHESFDLKGSVAVWPMAAHELQKSAREKRWKLLSTSSVAVRLLFSSDEILRKS